MTQFSEQTPIASELQKLIKGHLNEHRNLSLNALSKRCRVSEPTLRRIVSGKVKTNPTVNTIVDILSSLSKETNITKLVDLYPGPLAESLRENFGTIIGPEEYNYEFSEVLNRELKDPKRYLIFKLASNSNGVTRAKIRQLFGELGDQKCDDLINLDLIHEQWQKNQRVLKTKVEGFYLHNDLFKQNFKALADYIDTSPKLGEQKNLFYNLSESVNEQALRDILNIQRQALKKMVKILNDEKSRGELPVFILNAIDTLDINEDSSSFPGPPLQ
jgi:transcriptional regulator with XRE-family HTH domain